MRDRTLGGTGSRAVESETGIDPNHNAAPVNTRGGPRRISSMVEHEAAARSRSKTDVIKSKKGKEKPSRESRLFLQQENTTSHNNAAASSDRIRRSNVRKQLLNAAADC